MNCLYMGIVCSTPYGIRGSSTREQPCELSRLTVLNALRHQRFVHTRQRTDKTTSQSAQRLTASEVRPQPEVHSRLQPDSVLNALRHQRFVHCTGFLIVFGKQLCSTPYGIRGSSTVHSRAAIDSATRAQRLTASEVRPPSREISIIKESRAQRLTASEVRPHLTSDQSFLCWTVLNALRHQRFVHDCRGLPPDIPPSCSTPYGIRGSSTCHANQDALPPFTCSTPYGIRGSSTDNQPIAFNLGC